MKDYQIKYKGYIGIVHFDDEAMVFHCEVIGLGDVIKFRGTTQEEIKKEFEISIDGYLEGCKELGQEPAQKNTLLELFLNAPCSEIELDISRNMETSRDIEL